MSKGKAKAPEAPAQSIAGEIHQLPSAELLREAAEITDFQYAQLKLKEIERILFLPRNLDEKGLHARILRALELFESIAPTEGIEAMLAVQMIGAHSAAQECLRRANNADTIKHFDTYLRNAQKLMALYARQLEALNRHRGKGQQKVTVEYVNVESGGQAIVGAVETGHSAVGAPAPPPEIETSAAVLSQQTGTPPARVKRSGGRQKR